MLRSAAQCAAVVLCLLAAVPRTACSRASAPRGKQAQERQRMEAQAKEFFEANGRGASHTNNWVILVDASRFWANYRHAANVLSMYHIAKKHGIPDSNIIVMLGDDVPCNVRNIFPATVFNNQNKSVNLYGSNVEVDYRGYEVTVEAFLRTLTGRHDPGTPQNKRMLSDARSNVLIYLSGHGGDQFLKFQDAAEVTSQDIAESLSQMWLSKRYRSVLLLVETCQAATLIEDIDAPAVVALGSSIRGQNSYSHHNDMLVGQHVVDRLTYYTLEALSPLASDSAMSVLAFFRSFKPQQLRSQPAWETTHPLPLNLLRVMDFFSSKASQQAYSGEGAPAKPGQEGTAGWGSVPVTVDTVQGGRFVRSTSRNTAGGGVAETSPLARLSTISLPSAVLAAADSLRAAHGDAAPLVSGAALLLAALALCIAR